ncbi:MAG: PUA domain-containing protein [Methanoculleaceae archaeon]
MSNGYLQNSWIEQVRTIADFQFGAGAGAGIFSDDVECVRSRTGRIRHINLNGRHLATIRAQDGRLTLSMEGARRLHAALPPPAYRVVIMDEAIPFVAKGKNAFCKHVTDADSAIRAGDEVLVVGPDDRLYATGTAVLSGSEMLAFNIGPAVKVRQGCEE